MANVWVPLDTLFYEDEEVEHAAEIAAEHGHGPLVIALVPVLLAKAKQQADAGRVEFTFRSLSAAVHSTPADVAIAIRALVSSGVITCHQESERGAAVAFDPEAWRRRNNTAAQAAKRAKGKAHEH